MFKATVTFKGAEECFDVADAGHSAERAKIRAAAHFFYQHPEMYKGKKNSTFREAAINT
jgi:hypothetical protein